jgi:hypothetical protein
MAIAGTMKAGGLELIGGIYNGQDVAPDAFELFATALRSNANVKAAQV